MMQTYKNVSHKCDWFCQFVTICFTLLIINLAHNFVITSNDLVKIVFVVTHELLFFIIILINNALCNTHLIYMFLINQC